MCYGLRNNADVSVTCISTSMFGHIAISSPKLNASLYLYSMFIIYIFSDPERQDFSKSTYFFNISLSELFVFKSKIFTKVLL